MKIAKHVSFLKSQSGHSLVELMVALAVSMVVISGTYFGYTFFNRQQELLLTQTNLDRNLLGALELIASDARMAGYQQYPSGVTLNPAQAIQITSSSDLSLLFDNTNSSGVLLGRVLVRYYLVGYAPSGGVARNRLYRDRRTCNAPASGCTVSSSTSTGAEPILDWVQQFVVTGMHQKASGTGTFAGQFQAISITLAAGGYKKVEGVATPITKSMSIVVRARNVSLVP